MPALILVADDDPVQRRLLEAQIRRFGHDVVMVEGGEAALARLRQQGAPRIDLLLLDLVMPDRDGMGVLDAMRREGLDCPVIVQTAHGSIDTVISAMRGSSMNFFWAASRVALSGHSTHEKTTTSSPSAFTAPLKSVTLPSGTSSPQHSTTRVAPNSLNMTNVIPAIAFTATFATGTPVAFATNGTVRLARGLTSIT